MNRLFSFQAQPEATSLLGKPLFSPVVPEPDRARMEADQIAAFEKAWHLANGRQAEAMKMWERILAGTDWPSFGHIAAEADVARGRR